MIPGGEICGIDPAQTDRFSNLINKKERALMKRLAMQASFFG